MLAYASMDDVLPAFEWAFAHILDPIDVTLKGSLSDNADHKLEAALGVDIFMFRNVPYAFVAGFDDDGVQAIKLEDPDNPEAVGAISDNGSRELNGVWDLKLFVSGSNLYAAVTGADDDGVQILRVTDPTSMTAVGSIEDDTHRTLRAPLGIDVFTQESGAKTYAAVASHENHGIQVLNLTDPTSPQAMGMIQDNADTFLRGAYDVTVFSRFDQTYAAVAANLDDALQILNLTDLNNITPVSHVVDTPDLALDAPGRSKSPRPRGLDCTHTWRRLTMTASRFST